LKYSVIVNGNRLTVEAVGDAMKVGEKLIDATLEQDRGGNPTVLRIGSRVYRIALDRNQKGDGTQRRGRYDVWVNGERFTVDALDERRRAIEEATAQSAVHRVADLRAPMPGLILKVHAQVGDSVTAGQGLVVMEAMKMENELRATAAGIVTKVHAAAGRAVDKGTVLIEFQ
jgi:biotin carboxyl carrier protein